jgi:hypothetical protein
MRNERARERETERQREAWRVRKKKIHIYTFITIISKYSFLYNSRVLLLCLVGDNNYTHVLGL